MNKQLFSFPAEQAPELMAEWVESMVVGLNLCPFAAPELRNKTIRYAVSSAETDESACADFLQELEHIQGIEEEVLSTTLLSFTHCAVDFEDYLDLLDRCQYLLEKAGLDGVFQLASFHPRYCFQGMAADHVSNWTNRAPFPTIHIIREGQMSRVLAHYKHPEEIPERNIQLMEKLGYAGLVERFPPLANYWEAGG